MKIMKRLIAIVSVVAAIAPSLAAGQSSQAPSSLVDVAKAEELRRKTIRKPAKVYTNDSLKTDAAAGVPPASAPPSTPAAPAPPSTTVPAINIPGGAAEPAAKPGMRDQKYWQERITSARAAVERSRLFAEALQSRINALTTDYVNRDDPAQRALLETQRKTALAELDRVKKDVEAQQKEITAIEDEARRAGVPSGWLRPGV